MNQRVAIVLGRGEAIRNWAYSSISEDLAELELVWCSVIPNDRVAQLMAETRQLIKLDEPATTPVLSRMRTLLDSVHSQWLGREFDNEASRYRADVHARSVSSPLARARFAAQRVSAPTLATANGVRVLAGLERVLTRASRVRSEAAEQLVKMRPGIVMNGSHVHSRYAMPVMDAMWRHGIATATFLFSWDNLTSQGRLLAPHDLYFAWNESIAQDLRRLYPKIGTDQVVVTGTPQFDPHFDSALELSREQFCVGVGLDPSRPIVLYTTGMANHMPGEPEVVEQIADALGRRSDGAQLFVRVYAKDLSGRFESLRQRRPDIVVSPTLWEPKYLTPLPEDTSLWSNTLRHCDVGINVASTVSLELAMFDTPVLNVAWTPSGASPIDYARYYKFAHYRPVVDSGAVQLIERADLVDEMVNEALNTPERFHHQRSDLMEQMFGSTLDGQSARRVAHALRDFVT